MTRSSGTATALDPPASAERRSRDRRARLARHLHPFAWWLWAGGMAATAMRTTNIVLLALVLAVVALVVSTCRSAAPWARSFTSFLRLGIVVIVLRMVLQAVFGARLPGTVLFTIPEVELPAFMAGVSLGGPVTLESLIQSFSEGARLAVLLACFGAVNSLSSPYRLLRAMPAVLYEAGVAVTMGVAFAPEAVASVGRLREARFLRGRSSRGFGALRGVAVPVLEGALDRSVSLAASMDARGYGRRGSLSVRRQRASAAALLGGLLGATVGMYGVLDASAPRLLALPALATGVALCACTLVWKGARSTRTRYRPDPWLASEWLVAGSGVAALGLMVLAGRVHPLALTPAYLPLTWPTVPPLALAAALAGLVPVLAAPPPPGLGGTRPAHGAHPDAGTPHRVDSMPDFLSDDGRPALMEESA